MKNYTRLDQTIKIRDLINDKILKLHCAYTMNPEMLFITNL
jgi:hypothetical protein